MRLGLISDTHDNLTAIKKAVQYFNMEKVDAVLHAGDIVAPFAAALFNKLECQIFSLYSAIMTGK